MYELRREWVLPEVAVRLPAFEGKRIRVEPTEGGTRLTVKPYRECDGATGVPDWPRGVTAGALFHDAWYLDLEAMARAWGWSEAAVRRTGDDLFWLVMRRAGANRVLAAVYWAGVRSLGGAYRALAKATRRVRAPRKGRGGIVAGLVVAAALAGMAGCAGCLAPVDWSDTEEPYVPPEYGQVEG